ncbi:MAG: DUF342 domain-containing protein [Clostridium sp.]|nr:DUF342 domain-containing protein [Clostridium sp.]
MNNQTIYQDEYVKIFSVLNEVSIESFKAGITLNQINKIILLYPYIKITDFSCIRDAVLYAPMPPKKFGELKERISISVSHDGLKAMITFNCPKKELDFKNREKLTKESFEKLKEKNITFGVKRELFFRKLENSKSYVIAEGIAPTPGKDCEIRMYELNDPKPQVKEDGTINYYELELINKVKAGDWLGERINATDGIPGNTVFSHSLPPVKGKNYPLLYDKNTVYEVSEGDRIVLYSKISGAVNYSGGKIAISDYLEIDGDVDFKTGNINFDGYVSIKGTVIDGFSVKATRDIEINSPLGLGNVRGIESKNGSIFIKGGVASKDGTEISAGKNAYIKFIDNVKLICGVSAYIGFYCINSIIYAKEILVESIKGNIYGGTIYAESKIATAFLGTQLERRTIANVKGLNKDELYEKLKTVKEKINELKNEQQSLKQTLQKQNSEKQISAADARTYAKSLERFSLLKEEISSSNAKRKNLLRFLRTKGDGEISISKKIFPNCSITIKNKQIEIKEPYDAATFFVIDGELRKV